MFGWQVGWWVCGIDGKGEGRIRRVKSILHSFFPVRLTCCLVDGGVLMERDQAEFEEPNRCSTAVFMFGWHVTQTRPPCMRGPASTPNGRWLPNIAHKLCGHRLPHRMAAGCPTLFPNYAALSCQPGIPKLQMGNQNYELSNWQPVAQHLSPGMRPFLPIHNGPGLPTIFGRRFPNTDCG